MVIGDQSKRGLSEQVVYVHSLTPRVLLRTLFSQPRPRLHFLSISGAAASLSRLVDHVTRFEREQLVGLNLCEIMDESGGYTFQRIQRDLTALCESAVSSRLHGQRWVERLGEGLDPADFRLYCQKAMKEELESTVNALYAFRCHARSTYGPRVRPVVYITKTRWVRELQAYGNTVGIEVRVCGWFPAGSWIHRCIHRWARRRSAPKACAQKVAMPPDNHRRSDRREPDSRPIIAALYTGKTGTFKESERSDWFWLVPEVIPGDRVTIYFERKDLPETPAIRQVLAARGVRSVALSRAASHDHETPVYAAGREAARICRAHLQRLMREVGVQILRGRRPSLYFVIQAARLAWEVGYWTDFCERYCIALSVNGMDFSKSAIPLNVALRRRGGISVAYQFSNLQATSLGYASNADVHFAFGSEYRSVWANNGSLIDTLVYAGYITDHAFKKVRPRAEALRQRLRANGAQFVVTYLDENSSNELGMIISNAHAAASYRWFLQKVLDDGSFGVIFKPGYPRTLLKRIGDLDGLFERAEATGRCILLDEGTYVTEQYPCEAALAADLTIGLLVSGTAALESFLSGAPTVFLDLERFYANPVYGWGQGRVVFDNFADLEKAIQAYRAQPETRITIGNLSAWAEGRDPFRDGQASRRMARYIKDLFDALEDGATREQALTAAFDAYVQQWGGGAAERFSRRGGLAVFRGDRRVPA